MRTVLGVLGLVWGVGEGSRGTEEAEEGLGTAKRGQIIEENSKLFLGKIGILWGCETGLCRDREFIGFGRER